MTAEAGLIREAQANTIIRRATNTPASTNDSGPSNTTAGFSGPPASDNVVSLRDWRELGQETGPHGSLARVLEFQPKKPVIPKRVEMTSQKSRDFTRMSLGEKRSVAISMLVEHGADSALLDRILTVASGSDKQRRAMELILSNSLSEQAIDQILELLAARPA